MHAERLVQASDGRIYGTLNSRGSYAGVLFAVDSDGGNHTVFRSSSTNRPSGVIEGSDGRLYGTVAGDPRSNVSGVFRIDRDGNNYTLLRTFSTGQPWSGVIQDPTAGSMEQLLVTACKVMARCSVWPPMAPGFKSFINSQAWAVMAVRVRAR
jgi:hypothetical protein